MVVGRPCALQYRPDISAWLGTLREGSLCFPVENGSTHMPIFFLSMIALLLVPQRVYADDASRRDWLLCQAGHVERCEQLLRTSLDDEMRMLVEIDRRIAMEKAAAYARLFMHECDRRSNVRACDRALTYNLSAKDRQDAVNMRNTVMQRRVVRVSK